jgi:uncharacterized protein (DUF983 family)
MAFVSVNWLSIVIAAAAAWIFGGIYYTALSKPWMAAQGKTMEQCQAEMAAKSGAAEAAPFILVFVGEIIIAWALYGILVHLNAFTLRGSVISAVLIWFGFVLTTITGNYAFHGKKPMLIAIDSVAWLGAFVIIGAIVGWMGR